MKTFRKEDLCASLLKIQILNMENDNNWIQNGENQENFLCCCQEYFLEILFKIKEPNFIRNELNIIKSDEIRNVLNY